jgi:sugar phosphate isomerase/epimerase
MISIGRGIRWYNNYQDEVTFCTNHGFDFMQVWFKNGEILVDNIPKPKEVYIKNARFPIIIHAVFNPEDFEIYGDRLLDLVDYFGHNEVIVHPVCVKPLVDSDTEIRLAKQVEVFSEKAQAKGVTWYLENNSVIDGFHYNKEELNVVYSANTYVEQLLDVAHIDNYQHLENIISVKFPKCLHVAGKHFNIPHEHLPLTQGDIDYKLVFQKYLKGFDGRIILEVDGTDEEILVSKKDLDEAVNFVK